MSNYQEARVKLTNKQIKNCTKKGSSNIKIKLEKLQRRRFATWIISKNMTNN